MERHTMDLESIENDGHRFLSSSCTGQCCRLPRLEHGQPGTANTVTWSIDIEHIYNLACVLICRNIRLVYGATERTHRPLSNRCFQIERKRKGDAVGGGDFFWYKLVVTSSLLRFLFVHSKVFSTKNKWTLCGTKASKTW